MKLRAHFNDQAIVYPALLTDHEKEFVPAFVKFIFWNEEGVQIRPAPDDGLHLRPHKIANLKRHVNLSSWSYSVAEHGLVILTWDPVSKSKCHQVKLSPCMALYDVIQELKPPAYARKGAQQLVEQYKEEGHQVVEWYVADGLDTALILKKKGDTDLVAQIHDFEVEENPAIRLDNIGLWPVRGINMTKLFSHEAIEPPLYDEIVSRRFKGRDFCTLFWLRWNGVKNGVITRDTKVLTYLAEHRQPSGDTEVVIPEGWYVIKPIK